MRGVPRLRRAMSRPHRRRAESPGSRRCGGGCHQVRIGVVVETMGDPKPVAERAGDAPHPGRGANDRDRLDLEPDRPRPRALAQHDVEREVLHGRVQDLLDHVRQAVDLVDEQDVARAAGRSGSRPVAGPLDGGPRGRPQLGAHLGCDDGGQRRLAQPGRPVQEDVVHRLRPLPGGVDEDGEVLLDPVLAGELIQAARTDGGLERAFLLGAPRRCRPVRWSWPESSLQAGRGRPRCRHRADAPPPARPPPGPAGRQAPLAGRCPRSAP